MCVNMDKQAKEGKSVNVFRGFRCFALDGIASFCFGTSFEAVDEPDFASSIEHAMHASMPHVPLMKNFPSVKFTIETLPSDLVSLLQPPMKGLMEMRKVCTLIVLHWPSLTISTPRPQTLKKQVQEVLQHPEMLKTAPHPTIFHELLNKEHGHKIPSFTELRDEALLMVFAGTDTSSNTLTLATINVLHNTDIHKRLNAELMEAWPVLSNRPRYEDLEGLPYMVR